LTDPTPYIFGVKVSTLVASAVMGIIAVLLDIRRHSVLTGILAVAAGMGVAVLATDPIVSGLKLARKSHTEGCIGALNLR
jgi:hypothetical protein